MDGLDEDSKRAFNSLVSAISSSSTVPSMPFLGSDGAPTFNPLRLVELVGEKGKRLKKAAKEEKEKEKEDGTSSEMESKKRKREVEEEEEDDDEPLTSALTSPSGGVSRTTSKVLALPPASADGANKKAKQKDEVEVEVEEEESSAEFEVISSNPADHGNSLDFLSSISTSTYPPSVIESLQKEQFKLLDGITTNPDAYFSKYKLPGEKVKKERWSAEESEKFLHLFKTTGVSQGKWGLFSMHIEGRIGIQCQTHFRTLLRRQLLRDPVDTGVLRTTVEPCVAILEGVSFRLRYYIHKEKTRIGRSPCGQYGPNHIDLHSMSKTVSRSHALIYYEKATGKFMLRCYGRHGVLVFKPPFFQPLLVKSAKRLAAASASAQENMKRGGMEEGEEKEEKEENEIDEDEDEKEEDEKEETKKQGSEEKQEGVDESTKKDGEGGTKEVDGEEQLTKGGDEESEKKGGNSKQMVEGEHEEEENAEKKVADTQQSSDDMTKNGESEGNERQAVAATQESVRKEGSSNGGEMEESEGVDGGKSKSKLSESSGEKESPENGEDREKAKEECASMDGVTSSSPNNVSGGSEEAGMDVAVRVVEQDQYEKCPVHTEDVIELESQSLIQIGYCMFYFLLAIEDPARARDRNARKSEGTGGGEKGEDREKEEGNSEAEGEDGGDMKVEDGEDNVKESGKRGKEKEEGKKEGEKMEEEAEDKTREVGKDCDDHKEGENEEGNESEKEVEKKGEREGKVRDGDEDEEGATKMETGDDE
uniref:Myb-like domain-containing protein n=1 Tax=Palpitomonas bilix TaxID=652834 RepID=A0A7S3G1Q4_9EUKA